MFSVKTGKKMPVYEDPDLSKVKASKAA